MDNENGGLSAPSYQELEECLRFVSQSLEWHAHGCCRGFHEGKPLGTGDATRLAKEMLERIGIPRKMPCKHDVPSAYRHGDEPLAWLAGYRQAIKDLT